MIMCNELKTTNTLFYYRSYNCCAHIFYIYGNECVFQFSFELVDTLFIIIYLYEFFSFHSFTFALRLLLLVFLFCNCFSVIFCFSCFFAFMFNSFCLFFLIGFDLLLSAIRRRHRCHFLSICCCYCWVIYLWRSFLCIFFLCSKFFLLRIRLAYLLR